MKRWTVCLLAALVLLTLTSCSAPVSESIGTGSRESFAVTQLPQKTDAVPDETIPAEAESPAAPDLYLLSEETLLDADGTLIQKRLYSYDRQGNMTLEAVYNAENVLTASYEYSYDDLGRTLSYIATDVEDGTVDMKKVWEWDAQGGYVERHYEGSDSVLTYEEISTVNDAGTEILNTQQAYSKEGELERVSILAWDDAGRLLEDYEAKRTMTLLKDGKSLRWYVTMEGYTYGENGQPASFFEVKTKTDDGFHFNMNEYVYHENGEPQSRTDYTKTYTDSEEAWDFEKLKALPGELREKGEVLSSQEYDEHGNTTMERYTRSGAFSNYQNSYDENGNLIRVDLQGNDGSASWIYTYTFYDSGAVRTCTSSMVASSNGPGNDETVLTYDERGNQTGRERRLKDGSRVFDREEWDYDDSNVMREHRSYTENDDDELYLSLQEQFDEYGRLVRCAGWKGDGTMSDINNYILTYENQEDSGYKMYLNSDGSYRQGNYREFDEKGNLTYYLRIDREGNREETFYTNSYDEYGNLIRRTKEGDSETVYQYAWLSGILSARPE